MDAISNPRVRGVVLMSSSQVGKTECVLNTIGFHIEHDPAPILIVQPTLDMGKAFSKDKMSPMFRDTPALSELVRTDRSKDGDSSIMHKSFDGGHLTISGANSAASLASRSIRILCCDEVDRYPPSAGSEGDPVKLAVKRTTTFWNRKLLFTSTPTIKGISRIEHLYSHSDMRRWEVPCAKCGNFDFWDQWGLVKWKKTPEGKVDPDSVGVQCAKCEHVHTELERLAQVREGRWTATGPDTAHYVGFHINQIVSPWVPLSEMVREFYESKGNPEMLRTWVNTSLGESFEEEGETTDWNILYKRREPYTKIPKEVVLLTAGVDVQDNRLEVEVVGWSHGHESWGVQVVVFMGDPGTKELWDRLDQYLLSDFEREDGIKMQIKAACVDSGGHYTQEVYKFCTPRNRRMIHAIKGVAGPGKGIINKPTKGRVSKFKGKEKYPLILVGVDTAKERLLLSWLRIETVGPGYCHFPMDYNEEYFHQLTCEKQVTKYVKGFPRKEWTKQNGVRNEALDRRIYAMAALELLNPNYDILAARNKHSSDPVVRRPQGMVQGDWFSGGGSGGFGGGGDWFSNGGGRAF